SRRTKRGTPIAETSAGAVVAESVERRTGAKGNTHKQSTHWTLSQVRVSQALARIRQLVPSHTRGRSRMRESRTYGSGRGACDETHVPTATAPRTHRAPRRHSGYVAAWGAGAAARADAAHRCADGLCRERPWSAVRGRGLPGGTPKARLDGGSQHQYQNSLGDCRLYTA